jgi:hypothetical protein
MQLDSQTRLDAMAGKRAAVKTAIEQLSDEGLRNLLLTCDGEGKQAKAAALEELLRRQRLEIENEIAQWDGGQAI